MALLTWISDASTLLFVVCFNELVHNVEKDHIVVCTSITLTVQFASISNHTFSVNDQWQLMFYPPPPPTHTPFFSVPFLAGPLQGMRGRKTIKTKRQLHENKEEDVVWSIFFCLDDS